MFKVINTFLSVVVVVEATDTPLMVEGFLKDLSAWLGQGFSHHEVILVDNHSGLNFAGLALPEGIRSGCYILKLAGHASLDVAYVAGMERANGDYVVLFDTMLREQIPLLTEMYLTAQQGYDFVILRDRKPKDMAGHMWGQVGSPARLAFFLFMRWAGHAEFHILNRKEGLVSRRALNWILRYRHRSTYLEELYAASGYKRRTLEVEIAGNRHRLRADSSRAAWGTLTRMSSFPTVVAGWSISLMVIGIALLLGNALAVRLLGVTLLGTPAVSVPGWTYLVILISLGFLLTNVTLYAMLRVLLVTADDMRPSPQYVVEAFHRL